MDLFYGTYLTYHITQLIQKHSQGLTVKEIEEKLYLYPTPREQVNFRNRIRKCLKSLYEHEVVLREEIKHANVISHKYKLYNEKKTAFN